MGDRDGLWYFCCRHCAPGCGYANRHALGCAQGCLPYTNRQQEDETVTETPWYAEKTTSDIPSNIPAEALQEMLDFERSRWDEERAELIENFDKASALSKMLDDFILSTVVNLGAIIYSVRGGRDADEALELFFTEFLDHMPTPSKIDLQEHLDEDHALSAENVRDAQSLIDFLIAEGYDPEAIVAEKKQRDQDFIKTILGGMMSASFNDEPISDDALEADDDPDS